MKETKSRACLRIGALTALILCLVLATPSMLGIVPATQAAGMSVWSRLPLYGGTIYNVVIDPENPSTLSAYTGGGVFRSTDNGGHWKQVATGIVNITKNPSSSVLYGKTSDGAFFRSTDNGDHWTAVNAAGIVTTDIGAIVVNPGTPRILYALMVSPQGYLTYGSNVFRSIDSGNHWAQLSTGLAQGDAIISLAINPHTPTALYIVMNEAAGLIRSVDGGDHWMNVGAGLPDGDGVRSLVFDPQISAGLYAVTGSHGLLHSTDSGDHWEAKNAGLPQGESLIGLIIDPSAPATMYAIVGYDYSVSPEGANLFRSTDGGSHWARMQGIPHDAYIGSVVFDPKTSSTVYLTSGDGVLRSTDHGVTWATRNAGLDDLRVIALTIDSNTPSHMYAGTQSGVFRTVDGGKTWTETNTGITDMNVTVLAINPLTPSTLYAVAQNRIFRSINGGSSWSMLDGGLPSANAASIVINPRAPSILYAATDDGVFRSTDSGSHWTAANSGLTQKGNTWDLNTQALAINPITPATLYCSTRYNGLFRSYNSGTTWTAIDTPPSDYGISCLVVDPINPSTLYANTESRVYRSTNSGTSWSMVLNPKAAVNSLTINPAVPSTVYVGIWGNALRSANRGATWAAMNMGLASNSQCVMSIAFDPVTTATMYAGTEGRGVLRSLNSGTTWTAMNIGLGNANVRSVVVNPRTPSILYAGTDGGVFRYGPVSASTNVIQLKIGNATMYVNGKPVALGTAPIIMNSRTFLPVRAVVEAAGGSVAWDASTQKVTIARKGKTLELWIGKNVASLDGQSVTIDSDTRVVPLIKGGTTLLPLRFVAETLSLDVEWDAKSQTTTILYST
ncbi:MAG: stalk domain-containing protein [Candidatus Cryosericum sp.]